MVVSAFLLTLILGSPASADPYVIFGKGFTTKPGTEKVLTNLPPVLSQDSLGLCYSYTAAVALNYTNCKVQNENFKRKNNPKRIDCTKLSDKDAFSGLGLARYSKSTNEDFRGIAEGGNPAAILEWIAVHGENGVPSEDCLSLDKVLSKLGGATPFEVPEQREVFNKLKKRYEQFQKMTKGDEDAQKDQLAARNKDPNTPCSVCDFFSSVSNDDAFVGKIDLPKDPVRLLRAFNKETYDKFFDYIISPPECMRASRQAFFEPGSQKFKINQFPENDNLKKDKNRYQKTIAEIKKALKTDNMPIIGGICIGTKKKGVCDALHSAAITGIKVLCDPANNCYEAIRLQNSYGQYWQDSKNGGWVAAKELLDSTDYSAGTIAWLENQPEEKASK